jgi:hypothetical protein
MDALLRVRLKDQVAYVDNLSKIKRRYRGLQISICKTITLLFIKEREKTASENIENRKLRQLQLMPTRNLNL